MSRPLALLVLALAACDGGRQVAVRVSIIGPDSAESPVPGAVLVALPFDRDSLVRALEARAATPRPHTTELDSLYARTRGPFVALSAASARVAALRDSVRTAGTGRPALRSDLAAAEASLAQARRAVDSLRSAIGPRIDSLRLAVTRWENSTYAPYESLATARLRRVGRERVAPDTTGPDGWARVQLPAGRWWISTTSWDVTDPNRYWYWNVPVAADTIRLDSRNGLRRARH